MNTESDRTRDLNRVLNRKRLVRLGGIAIANFFFSLWMGQQAYSWMPAQASAEAVLVDKLFSFMTAVGTFIFVGVVGTVLYSVLFQRAAKYDESDGPPIEGNTKLEIIWTVLPILLVVWIGTVSYQTYDQMSILGTMTPKVMKTAKTLPVPDAVEPQKKVATGKDNPTSPIEVISRQWAWEFHYPSEGDRTDVSSTELHLPVDKRARFKLFSEDVLHGFYVPAFRVKQDIIPGREIDFSFTPIKTGRYRLRDSEFSGTYFAANQTNVVVESAADYQQWLKTAAATQPTSAENPAYDEFSKAEKKDISLGWATVRPAPSPVVNYSAPSQAQSQSSQSQSSQSQSSQSQSSQLQSQKQTPNAD